MLLIVVQKELSVGNAHLMTLTHATLHTLTMFFVIVLTTQTTATAKDTQMLIVTGSAFRGLLQVVGGMTAIM